MGWRWWWKRNREEGLEREIQAHLELESEELQDAGLAAEDARLAARRALGNTTRIKEDIRIMWTWTALDHLAQDVRYALRAMRHNPAFTAAAVLSLGLGIGANTAIFSLIDALLLRSLPVRNPGQLVQLQLVEQRRPGSSFGYPSIRALAERTDVFAGLCGFTAASFNLTSRDGIERVAGAWVTGGYYPTLGLEPFAGRLLAADDDQPGSQATSTRSANRFK